MQEKIKWECRKTKQNDTGKKQNKKQNFTLSSKKCCNEGDLGSIPGLGRSPGEGNGYPLHILAWRIPWTEELGRV